MIEIHGADERLEALIRPVAAAVEQFCADDGLPEARIEFVVAEDMAATVQALDGDVQGVESLSTYDVQRVGGVVAAKTMYRDAQRRDVIIVMNHATIGDLDNSWAQASALCTISHELAHVIIGRNRAAAGLMMDPVDATTLEPAPVARWLIAHAYEEHRADRFAEVLLAPMVSTGEGDHTEPLRLSDLTTWDLDPVLDEWEATVDRIMTYRLRGGDVGDMWIDVLSATDRILTALSHAQTGSPTPEPVTQTHAERFGPLHDCWSELTSLFADGKLIDPHDEIEVLDAATPAIVALWAQIGLTFTDLNPGFHIHVAGPADCWTARRAS